MQQPAAPLGSARAIGRLEPDGPWIGFGFRGGALRIVLGALDGLRDAPAEPDVVLALAIAYFTDALAEAPPEVEATQADLSALIGDLIRRMPDAARRAQLQEALDAIDDGLAGDAVAGRLAAARLPMHAGVDPVELLLARSRELASSARS
jgi:hypothetical protein